MSEEIYKQIVVPQNLAPTTAETMQTERLDQQERRTFLACWAGWCLDGMDLQMYPFVIPTLITLWSISHAKAGMLATTTLLLSAVGGWVAGILADRIGRVRTLQITVLWFAFFSLLCGVAQNFTQLFAARAMLGLGFGGEYAVGAVLLAETIRQSQRGRVLGLMSTGMAIGWGVAALLYTGLFAFLAPAVAWRWLFIVGAVPAVFALFMQRYLREPPIYSASKAALKAQGKSPNPLEIFSGKLLVITVVCSLLSSGAMAATYAVSTWLPAFLHETRGFNSTSTGGYMLVTIFGSLLGYTLGAFLSDRVGRRRVFLIFGAFGVFVVLGYTMLPVSGALLLFLGLPLGFCTSGIFAATPALYNEIYPTSVRASGLGFVHNVGRGIGGSMPLVVGLLAHRIGLGHAIGIVGAGGYALVFVMALIVPETRGRKLTD